MRLTKKFKKQIIDNFIKEKLADKDTQEACDALIEDCHAQLLKDSIGNYNPEVDESFIDNMISNGYGKLLNWESGITLTWEGDTVVLPFPKPRVCPKGALDLSKHIGLARRWEEINANESNTNEKSQAIVGKLQELIESCKSDIELINAWPAVRQFFPVDKEEDGSPMGAELDDLLAEL